MQELQNQSGGLKKKNRVKGKPVKNTFGLLQTEWHQGSPFDTYCGIYSGEIHNSVGCTPLAIAQLTKYYNYPLVGLESISGSTYDWANMLAYGSLMTDSVTIKPVARLCKDAGIVTNANYGYPNTSVSFSTVSPALNSKFNYTARLASWASYYPSLNEWIDSLKSDIAKCQPIIYGGEYNNADHTWIIDDYDSLNNIFHFNQGQENTSLNDWYPTTNILSSDAAVFNIKPDKDLLALAIPYSEDFEKVAIRGYKQIPINTGVSDSNVFYVDYDYTGTNKQLLSNNLVSISDWFLIKKINLNCGSVPVLKFKYIISDNNGFTPSDSLIVQVSNNNRTSWNDLFILDKSNYKDTEYKADKVISLNDYKNDIVNIRFKCVHETSTSYDLTYKLDDIEVGQLELSYPELTDNMRLSPKTVQSVKVAPSITGLQKKSKGYEDYDIIMDYYVKRDSIGYEYEKMYTDSLCENGVFEYPDWNTELLAGKHVKIRSVARTKADSTTLTSKEIGLFIEPIVELVDLDLFKSDYYSMDSIHVFEATCTDANWNDYPYMESMKFYFKKEGETSYTEIPAPPVKTTYYTRTWDSKAYTGEVIIKATASYYSDATYSELYETSDSITVQIFDGQTCVITSPKPAEEESWDFEFAPYIYRGYYSDHSLEYEATFITTLKDVDDDAMIFNGSTWSEFYFNFMTCPETKYHWGYLGYEWQWAYYVTTGHTGEINGMEGLYNTYPFWDTLGPTKKDKTGICKRTLFFDHKRETDPDSESGGSEESKFVSYYDKGYKAYVNDYEHLYPGIYNAAYHAYDINDGITDIANPASVDFLIPEWKLKLLNESKWFDYEHSSTTGPTYVERTEYHEGDKIHSMVWHPYEYYDKNTINYKITNSDTEAIIFEKDLTGTDYLTDTFITDNAPEDTLAYYHHIWDTSGLEPGFYNIRTEGMSIIDNINVVQEREIQICPYYEQWENNGAWSEDWPAPVGSDTLYWKIKDLGYNYYAANQYMLEAHYETGFHLNSTTTEEQYSVNDTYPAMLEICIAARQKWNRDGDFWYWEDQLSNFTVELSKDGDNYVKVKTLDLQKDGYIDYPWNLPDNPEQSNPNDTEDTQYYMTCAMNFYFPIGEVYGSGNSLKIRLGIEGIPGYFTDEVVDNKITHIDVDEIKLWYMKGRENRPAPRNLAAVQAKESNTVTLTFAPPAVTGSEYPEKYLIYREGKLIWETTSTSFTDTEISGSTEYNYVVVAYYPGYDFYESSMLDCSIHYETAPIT